MNTDTRKQFVYILLYKFFIFDYIRLQIIAQLHATNLAKWVFFLRFFLSDLNSTNFSWNLKRITILILLAFRKTNNYTRKYNELVKEHILNTN